MSDDSPLQVAIRLYLRRLHQRQFRQKLNTALTISQWYALYNSWNYYLQWTPRMPWAYASCTVMKVSNTWAKPPTPDLARYYLRSCLRQASSASLPFPLLVAVIASKSTAISSRSPWLALTSLSKSYAIIMSQRKSRAPSGSDDSSGPRIPPVPQGGRGRRSGDDFGSPKRRRRHSGRGYDMPREKPLPSKVELQLCVFHGAPSHRWRTAPFTFDRRRDDDRDLWEEIRHIYRDELQGVWRRIFGFKKLKHIIPIEVHSQSSLAILLWSRWIIICTWNKLQEHFSGCDPTSRQCWHHRTVHAQRCPYPQSRQGRPQLSLLHARHPPSWPLTSCARLGRLVHRVQSQWPWEASRAWISRGTVGGEICHYSHTHHHCYNNRVYCVGGKGRTIADRLYSHGIRA